MNEDSSNDQAVCNYRDQIMNGDRFKTHWNCLLGSSRNKWRQRYKDFLKSKGGIN